MENLDQHFFAGMTGVEGGVEWRVVNGRKHPLDLRLDIRTSGFVPVKMSLGFLFADFFFENENVLFPPERGFQGGDRYLDYLEAAPGVGWQKVAAELERERARKRAA